MSQKLNLDALSVDELWQLHEELSKVLSVRLRSEKRELERRLSQLRREKLVDDPSDVMRSQESVPKRKYPGVFPKYRNPTEPTETWSGRGKQPRWLTTAIANGHAIEEFVITESDERFGSHAVD